MNWIAKQTEAEKTEKTKQTKESNAWWEAIKAAEAKAYAKLAAEKANMTKEEWAARAEARTRAAVEETAKLDGTIYTR